MFKSRGDCAGKESDYFVSELVFYSRTCPVNWCVVILKNEVT